VGTAATTPNFSDPAPWPGHGIEACGRIDEDVRFVHRHRLQDRKPKLRALFVIQPAAFHAGNKSDHDCDSDCDADTESKSQLPVLSVANNRRAIAFGFVCTWNGRIA